MKRDNVRIWKETTEHYKDMTRQESAVFRRRHYVTPTEMASLEYKWPKVVVAPVYEKDCVYVATEYKERGFNPIVLNMCSWTSAGGGVDRGCRAQEEELFRRSNYFKHLHQDYYPLKQLDTIVSRGVEFSRYGPEKGYAFMEAPVQLDCIAAPAPKHPPLNYPTFDDFGKEADKTLMEQKIRMLLYTAAKNGNDCVILSAWGCGAYGCPPTSVAKLFKKVLGEFAGVFRETPFAILAPNYAPFAQEF